MKRKPVPTISEPTVGDIQANLPKSETIHLRVTKVEKDEIRATATALRLSITEYLVKCHGVIASKLHKGE